MGLKTLFLTGALASSVCAISVDKSSLRVNGAYDPLDVDTGSPRLTWRLSSSKRGDRQTAYQVQASSNSKFNSADIWDSGKIESEHPFVNWDGDKLSSRSDVNWRVKVWDVDGDESDWSQPGHFEVSLLDEDDWSATWITNKDFQTGSTSLPVFAKEFSLDCDVSKARLYLLGLGLHSPEINSKTITDEVLQPGYSTVNDTLLYSTYDVTKYLDNGENVLGVAIGKGIYDAEKPLLGRYSKFSEAYQELRMIAQLEYTCEGDHKLNKVLSDDSWITSVDGPYWETSWYGGEEYDARKEMPKWSSVDGKRSDWSKASLTDGPSGKLVSPRSPPLKVVETVKPVSVKKNDDGFYVFDFGVNFAGTFAFTMNQPDLEGTRITFWPDEGSSLGQSSTGGPTFDAYTLSSAKEQTYSPKWLYHGFQYLGVNTTWEPSLDDMEGLVIRATNEVVLNFSTSSDLLNAEHTIIDRSIQGNMHSVLTDCPHREKYGWLEQDHLVFEPLALGYDLQAYGDDLVRTMADAQASDPFGLIPDIAPEFGRPMGGGYRNDPNWGRAIINVPYMLYMYYGDRRILEVKHQYMIDYIDYLQKRAGGEPYLDDGGLGDWETLDTSTPKGITNTFAYHQAAFYLSKVESILGNDDSAAKYAKLADNIIDGFNSMWLNTTGDTAFYGSDSQASNALALDMGAVPAKYKDDVLQSLLDNFHEKDLTVGEIGLPSLFRVLRAARRDDVLFNWLSSTDMPSYGYEVEQGATSLWEHWDADETGGSLNHFMYGYGDLMLLQLSGLAQNTSSIAWREITYDPIIQGDLKSATTSYVTPAGLASASWSRDGKDLEYSITVPVGSTGWVFLNATDINEGGEKLAQGENGIISVKKGCQRTRIEVGSGTYDFSATLR